MKISSPVSLRRVFTMGAIFVTIQIASALADAYTRPARASDCQLHRRTGEQRQHHGQCRAQSRAGKSTPLAAAGRAGVPVSSSAFQSSDIYQQSGTRPKPGGDGCFVRNGTWSGSGSGDNLENTAVITG